VKDGSILGEEFTGSALADMIAQNEKNGSEFYSEYRMQRDRIRSQQIDLLREIVNNPNSAQETRQDAQQKLIAITQNLEREMELENLIIAKGFEDAVVLIQPSAVTVIVQGRTLPQDQIAKITDLAVRSLKVRAEDIVIIPKP
jgi:stage III sporulation protein AH